MPVPGYHPPLPERLRFALKLALLAAIIALGAAFVAYTGPVQ